MAVKQLIQSYIPELTTWRQCLQAATAMVGDDDAIVFGASYWATLVEQQLPDAG